MLLGQIVHPLAQPRYDLGPAEPTFRLSHMKVMFQQTARQQADLNRLVPAQRDPASADYHQWLTPEQYADRFGPSVTDLTRVTAWLRSAGFTIEYTARGRDWVAFSGTAAQVQSALQTSVHRYQVRGKLHYAVATEPAIPSEFKPLVATLLGLNDFSPASMVVPANVSASGYSLAPGDLATIYDINPLYQKGIEGNGQKIVIVGQATGDPSLLADVQQFRSGYGLASTDIQFVPDGTPAPDAMGDVMEADLDLEWAGAIAPQAKLIYVYGTNASASAIYAIDRNLAPIISESFGECEAFTPAAEALQIQAAAVKANAMGITWIAASGDSGAAGCDPSGSPFASYGLAVNVPASVPEITAVGGTQFNEGTQNYTGSVNGASGGSAVSYIPEIAWNDTILPDYAEVGAALAATGGGVSTIYTKPSWQVGPGVPADGQRDVPDVALAGANDHDPYNIIAAGAVVQVGGTSAATPVFAGMLALLNQDLKSSGVGNINATLYQLAVSSPAMFHDIVNNNNIVPCGSGCDLGYNAGIGYDPTTGLGSVDAFNLVNGWAAATAVGPAPVVTAVSQRGQLRRWSRIARGDGVDIRNRTCAGAIFRNGAQQFRAGEQSIHEQRGPFGAL